MKKRNPNLKIIPRVEIPALFTEDERKHLWHISNRNHLTPGEIITSIVRRHLKTRYQIPRKEWYYVFGK